MDPCIEREQHLTRRHFFGRASTGLGHDRPGVAPRPRSLRGGSRWTSSRHGRGHRGFPQLRPQGQAGDLPVPVGRTLADGPVRSQAGSRSTARHRFAGLDPDGPAADGHDLATGPIPGRGQPVPIRRVMARAARRSPTSCLTRPGWPTSCASSRRCTPRRSTTTPPSPFSRRAPSLRGGPASAPGRPTAWGARTRTCRPSWS